MAHLVQETGDGEGRVFTLVSEIVVGRLKSCHIPIRDKKSSRNNTRIFQETGAWFVEDMGSSNGTFLNDKKIRKSPLRPGDLVTIGKTSFRFEPGAAPDGAIVPGPRRKSGAQAQAKGPARKPAKPAEKPEPKPDRPAAKPPIEPSAPAPPPTAPERVAALETPPAGIDAGEDADGEDVDELDLGFGDVDDDPVMPGPASQAPAAPAPKPQLVFRTPVGGASGGGARSVNVLKQDLSQRSGLFQAGVYAAVLALMAGLAYLAFKLAGSLI